MFFKRLIDSAIGFSFSVPAVFVALCLILIIVLVIASFGLGRYVSALRLKAVHSEELRAARNDAVKRSRAVLGGQAEEQVAPFLPGFPCNAADCRFIGKPVDFIAFPGAAKGQPIKEVLLIEVKTGNSRLSEREKEIQECVQSGKVRYVVWKNPALKD